MNEFVFFALGAGLVIFAAWLRQRYASFTAQAPGDYGKSDTPLDLRQHLNGEIRCDGVIYGPLGRVVTRFTGDFEVIWNGDTATMREVFRYDDGSSRERLWDLKLTERGTRIEARASDVVGVGRGVISGPTIQLRYRLRLPRESGGHVLDAVDWMYLTPDGSIVNRSQFRKFGLTMAELVATMRPVCHQDTAELAAQ